MSIYKKLISEYYKVQVDIYEGVDTDLNPINLNDDNPTSGKLVARLTQSFEYLGMKSITLNKPLKLQANKPLVLLFLSLIMVMVKLNLLLFFQKSQNHIMICHLSNKTTNDLIL